MKNKKKYFVVFGIFLVLKVALFCFLISGVMNAPAFAFAETEQTENAEVGGNDENVFTRFGEWFNDNTDEIISAVGVIVTLVIVPVVRAASSRSDAATRQVDLARSEMTGAVGLLGEATEKLERHAAENRRLTEENETLRREIEGVRAELMKNGEQLNALLNSVYTAFMGSNISDGVKGILSEYMQQALSYRGENEIAREKLVKTKELLTDVTAAVEEVDNTLSGISPIDR